MAVNINVPSQVKTYANLAAFPASGALKTIYIAEDTNKTYRWTGSVYTEISATAASTWGAIGGTLSNQTDLQTALNAKQNSLGYTPVPTSRTLTINGTTQDLSADRTFTISTGITIGTTAITSGTVGRVLFEGTGNVVQESANLFWDNANGRLGIGTSTPATGLDVRSGFNLWVGGSHYFTGTAVSGLDASLVFRRAADNGWVRYALGAAGTVSFGYDAGTGETQIRTPNFITFLTNNTERIRIFGFGNIGINTTTDAGFRLDVNGTARVSGLLSLTDNNGIQFTTGFGNNAGNMISSQGSSTLLVMNRGSRVLKFWNGGSQADQSIQIGFGIDALAPSNLVSSIVQIDSTTKGFLKPRLTTTQKNAIASPAAGLEVYDTTLNRPCFYDGTTWITL